MEIVGAYCVAAPDEPSATAPGLPNQTIAPRRAIMRLRRCNESFIVSFSLKSFDRDFAATERRGKAGENTGYAVWSAGANDFGFPDGLSLKFVDQFQSRPSSESDSKQAPSGVADARIRRLHLYSVDTDEKNIIISEYY